MKANVIIFDELFFECGLPDTYNNIWLRINMFLFNKWLKERLLKFSGNPINFNNSLNGLKSFNSFLNNLDLVSIGEKKKSAKCV